MSSRLTSFAPRSETGIAAVGPDHVGAILRQEDLAGREEGRNLLAA